jgi:hypothetical protein
MSTEERLAQVERQLRWLKRLGALGLAVGAVVVLVGQAKDEELPALVARSLEIKDRQGRVRIRVRPGPSNQADLEMLDGRGLRRCFLTVREDGSAGIAFVDEDSGVRLQLFVTRSGEPSLMLDDANGKRRTLMELSKDGAPNFSMPDAKGKVIWKAPGE